MLSLISQVFHMVQNALLEPKNTFNYILLLF